MCPLSKKKKKRCNKGRKWNVKKKKGVFSFDYSWESSFNTLNTSALKPQARIYHFPLFFFFLRIFSKFKSLLISSSHLPPPANTPTNPQTSGLLTLLRFFISWV